jgi:Lipoprotein LpqB beta-propeller domain/Sporulation and spore germination
MTPPRLVRAGLAVALTAGLLAACAQIPDSGSVSRVVGPESDQQEQIEFNPPGPAPGATPTEIVTGFIDAMQAIPPTTEFAAQFLTKEAATDWDPSRVVIYQEYDSIPTGSAVDVTVKREATLTSRGVYHAVLPSERAGRYQYLLRQQDGEWRIDNPLNAFYIHADTFARSYLPYSLYFMAPSSDALVPYPIYLPNGDQLATSLVQGVIDGPPAMVGQQKPVTAVPPGTGVDLSVSVTSEGIADIRLDGPGLVDLSDVQREMLSAQLVWTVSQVSGVNGVRIFVDGARWEIPGKPSVLDVGSFDPGLDPAERVGDTLYALEDGRLVYIETDLSESGLVTGTKVKPVDDSEWGQSAQGIRSFDVSLGFDQVLAVSSSGTTMLTGKLNSSKGQVPDVVSNGGVTYFGTDLSQPVATRSKEWLVVDRLSDRSRLLAVSEDGKRVRVLSSAPFRGQRIQSLALSPDGTRFAAVAQRIGRTGLGAPRLVLGQIRFADNGVSAVGVDGVHRLVTTGDALRQVRSVTWIDATTLGVLGSVDHAAVAPYTVRIDGSDLLAEWILPVGLGAPETLVSSVAEGGVYVRNARGRLWFEADGEWKPVGRRPLSSPTFPG